MTEPGDPVARDVAPAPTCAPTCRAYRVYRDGELVDEPADVTAYWRDDLVGLPARLLVHLRGRPAPGRRAGAPHRAGPQRADVPHQHRLPAGRARSAGRWSCRCGRCPRRRRCGRRGVRALPAGARRAGPLRRPGGDRHRATSPGPTSATRWRSGPGEVPVFWACGVTPQAVVMERGRRRHHAQAGAHVRHRPARHRPDHAVRTPGPHPRCVRRQRSPPRCPRGSARRPSGPRATPRRRPRRCRSSPRKTVDRAARTSGAMVRRCRRRRPRPPLQQVPDVVGRARCERAGRSTSAGPAREKAVSSRVSPRVSYRGSSSA